jgi:membrane-bound lytic murein transglycosylase B
MLGLFVALGACVVLLAFGFVRYTTGLVLSLSAPESSLQYEPSGRALEMIPPLYLHLYEAAAAKYGLDWSILAGIGTVECDNGQDPAPSCTVTGALNYAGAGGPAQFLVATWRRYGVTPTGIGVPNMWNPADAIFSMANYLHASGAPQNYRHAIYAYNHAWWYVSEVLAWAKLYRATYDVQTALDPTRSANYSGAVPAPTRSPRLARRRGPG